MICHKAAFFFQKQNKNHYFEETKVITNRLIVVSKTLVDGIYNKLTNISIIDRIESITIVRKDGA